MGQYIKLELKARDLSGTARAGLSRDYGECAHAVCLGVNPLLQLVSSYLTSTCDGGSLVPVIRTLMSVEVLFADPFRLPSIQGAFDRSKIDFFGSRVGDA